MTKLAALEPTTRAFPRRRVLVVGDLMADHYIYGQTERVSREAPVLIVRYERDEVKLGGGANAAANVRSLGGQVSAVGAMGRDPMGAALRRLFAEAGIELRAVSGVPTETKTRIYAGGINTTRQQMLRLDRGARAELPERIRKALARAVRERARDADAVLVSDYGAGVLGPEVRDALRGLSPDGLPICVDSRYGLRTFGGFFVCKPNEPELQLLTGIAIRGERDLLRAGREALQLLGCRALVVTRGRSGMAVFSERGQAELLPVHGHAEAVDVTGAGDTVIATLALALAAGAEIVDAARLANVAGALVVQKQGTATVSREELVRELRS
jgi:rfaE bifunctional protein kinase chain/domain